MKSTRKLNWQFPYSSKRMPILAKNCVATSQPLAAQAGLLMMQRGGNAVDAAIATAITLAVVEPTMNGIGSDLFAQIWDGKKLHGLNASGYSPQSWSREQFTKYNVMPMTGWDCVTVPGAVAGWSELSKKFGKLPFTTLFEPAIHYAKNGYLVSPIVAENWSAALSLKTNTEFSKIFLPGSKAPAPGTLFLCPAQAKTLQEIADSDGAALYRGDIGKKIVSYAKKTGGQLSQSDLANYQPQWVTPLQKNYRGYDLFELPPNGQGLTALIALGILQQFNINEYPVDSAISIHLQIEAMKLAFADAKRYIADPRHMTIKPEELLSSEYLANRAKLINLQHAQFPKEGIPSEQGTVYLTTADASGMMVSLIQSHYWLFGSGIVIPDTGIIMQNRGACFSLEKSHPNEVDGNKLPFHTIIPAFVMKDNKPLMSFGVMGGHMQAQGHVQFMVRVCDYQQNPQTAIDAPRWYISPTGKVSLEARFKPDVLIGLQQYGHDIVPSPMLIFGGAQAIYCMEDGYFAASDHRKDGQAVGF